MLNTSDLQSIEKIIVKVVTPINNELKTINSRLGAVETILETVETRLETVEEKIELLDKKVDDAQQDTIEALTSVITEGYTLHEERIKKLEDNQVTISQAQ